MKLPNTFGLHIQASRAETPANVYIGNLREIKTRPNRFAGFAPNGSDGNTNVAFKPNDGFEASAEKFNRAGTLFLSWPLMVRCRRQSNRILAFLSRRFKALGTNERVLKPRNRLFEISVRNSPSAA